MVKKSAMCADRASFQIHLLSSCCLGDTLGRFNLWACDMSTVYPKLHFTMPCLSLFLFSPISASRRCTHLLLGNASGSFALVLISVQVSVPDCCRTALILSRNVSYETIAFRGRFQYGLWHPGQRRGSLSEVPRGIHSCSQRSQR